MTLEVKRLPTMGFLSWIRLYHLAMADLVVACHMFFGEIFWWTCIDFGGDVILNDWFGQRSCLFWPSIFSTENHWTSTLDSTPMAPWQGAFLHWRATWRARVWQDRWGQPPRSNRGTSTSALCCKSGSVLQRWTSVSWRPSSQKWRTGTAALMKSVESRVKMYFIALILISIPWHTNQHLFICLPWSNSLWVLLIHFVKLGVVKWQGRHCHCLRASVGNLTATAHAAAVCPLFCSLLWITMPTMPSWEGKRQQNLSELELLLDSFSFTTHHSRMICDT